MMIEVKTEVYINAPIKDVWQKLSNFDGYSSWNSFITEISGEMAKGQKLAVKITLPGKKPTVFKPTVLCVEADKELRWVGILAGAWLFRGEHYFCLEKDGDDATRLIHGEIFSGLLAKPLLGMIGKATEEGFTMMNRCLSESLAPPKAKAIPERMVERREVMNERAQMQMCPYSGTYYLVEKAG